MLMICMKETTQRKMIRRSTNYFSLGSRCIKAHIMISQARAILNRKSIRGPPNKNIQEDLEFL